MAGILPCRIAWHLAAVSAKAAKKARTIEDKTILVIRTSRQVVLRKRPKRDCWQDCMNFRRWTKGIVGRGQGMAEKTGCGSCPDGEASGIKHIFTHKEGT
ncbi:MAG: hypothetical protein ACLURV_09100 [Gallintestinimicrobium sp.]